MGLVRNKITLKANPNFYGSNVELKSQSLDCPRLSKCQGKFVNIFVKW